jgi:hypothetical protein
MYVPLRTQASTASSSIAANCNRDKTMN